MSDLSFREARVEDRALIAAVMYRFARLAKEQTDPEEVAALFTPDGVFRLPDGTEIGPAQHSRSFDPEAGFPMVRWLRHHITTLDISFVGDDEAHVEAFALAITSEAGGLDHFGTWKDVLRRQPDGSWLIAVHDIPLDELGVTSTSWLGQTFPDIARLWDEKRTVS